jgi:hypothetical protein
MTTELGNMEGYEAPTGEVGVSQSVVRLHEEKRIYFGCAQQFGNLSKHFGGKDPGSSGYGQPILGMVSSFFRVDLLWRRR